MHNSELIFDFHSGFSENFEADQNGQYFSSLSVVFCIGNRR